MNINDQPIFKNLLALAVAVWSLVILFTVY